LKRPCQTKQLENKILEIHLRGKKLGKDVDTQKLSSQTAGLSGAEIAGVVQTASMLAVRDFIDKYGSEYKQKLSEFEITSAHLEEALKQVRSRIPSQKKTALSLTP